MIVTTIMGGLGNQLFQYAAGRAVAHRTGRRLVLDATLMPSPVHGGVRHLELEALPIQPTTRIVRRPGPGGRTRLPSETALRMRWVAERMLEGSLVREPTAQDVLVDLSSPPRPLAILSGYWQSHRYLAGVESKLRSELTPPVGRDSRVTRILDDLAGHDLVSLHVRRGDYVSDPRVIRSHGAQPIEYTLAAARAIADTCDRPAFAVLSDDPAWAAEHVILDAPVHHVEQEGSLSAVEALALMSRARHAVIANSSLSWWGAWLADHDAQQVVAPARWFVGRDVDPAHRLPPDWRVL